MKDWLAAHWAEIVTAVVALYGAVLATINIAFSRGDKKRRLRIQASPPMLVHPSLGVKGFCIFIEVANLGNRPVSIFSPYVLLPDRESAVYPQGPPGIEFPYDISEGKRCWMCVEERIVLKELVAHGYSGKVKLKVLVRDQTGRVYKAKKPYEFDIEERLKDQDITWDNYLSKIRRKSLKTKSHSLKTNGDNV